MTGSMQAAIAGLKTHMQNLNVIGNNIANVNTYGYKASRAVFKTSLYTTLTGGSNGTETVGGINPSQMGYGATVSSVDVDMSSGNYSVTGKSTDLMLDGDGFFLTGTKDIAQNFRGDQDDVNRLTSFALTRVGNFEFRADGYLAKEDGNCVYGFLCVGLANQADVDAGNAAKVGDPMFSDQLVPIRFPRIRTAYYDADGNEVAAAGANTTEGKTIAYPYLGTTAPAFGAAKATTGKLVDYGTDATTGESDLPMALFTNISFDPNTGIVTGISRDTEEVVTIGCVAVGTVTNPNGVTSMGDNYYKAGEGSGQLTVSVLGGNAKAMRISQLNKSISAANTTEIYGLNIYSSLSKMLSNGLEMSKTDLAQEIASMITTQRGYQANTRIITVTDSMLEELVNMKR